MGTHGFRNLFGEAKCVPLEQVTDLAGAEPRDTVVVVLGDTQVLTTVANLTGNLATFRARGGALLVATDRDDDRRLASLGVKVPGWVLRPDGAPAYYRRRPEYPLVNVPLAPQHPLLRGLRGLVAADNPSILELSPRGTDLEVLAAFGGLRPDADVFWVPNMPAPFLAAGGEGGDGTGRAVVVSSHRVFMNDLLIQPDNGNFDFASNCVRWLTEDGRRKRVLFVEDGRVQTNFHVPLRRLSGFPPLPIEVVDRVLHGLEQEDRLNQLLPGAPSNYVRWVVLLGSLLLLFWGLRRQFVGRHAYEPRLPLLARKVALAAEAPAVVVQRRAALLGGGNLWEAARDLARECFAGRAAPGGEPPAFAVAGGWRQRRRLGGLLCDLWRLAHDPTPVPVSARQLERVRRQAEELHAALDGGLVTLKDGE
jgi:hypothetical protein